MFHYEWMINHVLYELYCDSTGHYYVRDSSKPDKVGIGPFKSARDGCVALLDHLEITI